MTSLNFIRGLVRPLTLFVVVSGVVGLTVYYGITVDAKEAALLLMGFGGPVVGFWFKERGDRLPEDDNVAS
mgnify:CR=1 FL=1